MFRMYSKADDTGNVWVGERMVHHIITRDLHVGKWAGLLAGLRAQGVRTKCRRHTLLPVFSK